MTARRKRKDTAPPIGDHLLTLREAAEVLRLSTRTVREYTQRGEIEARLPGPAFASSAFLAGKDKRVAGINTSLARGRGSIAKTCPSYRRGLCEAISTIRAESPICWSGRMSATARSRRRCGLRTSPPEGEKAMITRN
jgi:excisionase family DNA binding protein